MICQNCHSEVTSGNPYCHNCGTKVSEKTTKFCGKCGSQVSAGNRFCPNCGDATDGSPRQQAQAAPVQYQQPTAPAPTYANQQIYGGQNQQHPSQYLNIKKLRTWSAINLLLSPLLGIWGLMLIKKIETESNEMIARQLYKKAKNICVIGSILGLISIVLYSSM